MLLQIVHIILTVLWWFIIAQAVMSWLIAFNVINTHNQFVGQHARTARSARSRPSACSIHRRAVKLASAARQLA